MGFWRGDLEVLDVGRGKNQGARVVWRGVQGVILDL